MAHKDSLLPRTAALWARVENDQDLRGFVLVGGTALALHIRHRLSEDLDFAWAHVSPEHAGGQVLPQQRISHLIQALQQEGMDVRKISHIAQEQDFLNDGLVLAEYQQDYLINGVKVTFFKASQELAQVLRDDTAKAQTQPCVASLEALFKAKSLVLAERNKSRDWLDLYVLIRDHGFSVTSVRQTFIDVGQPYSWDVAASRLVSLQPSDQDEGYSHLIERAPTLEDMRVFFRKALDQMVQEASVQPHTAKTPSF